MSKEEKSFKDLVGELLDAAAQEMVAAFERKATECEEKLRLSREEGQRTQELLDSLNINTTTPKILAVKAEAQIPGIKWEIPETPRIKEEPGVRIKEEAGEKIKVEAGDHSIKQEPRSEPALESSENMSPETRETLSIHQAHYNLVYKRSRKYGPLVTSNE